MKNITRLITLSLFILSTAGCSSFGGSKIEKVEVPKTKAITKQKLSSFFVDDGITVNFECVERDNRTLKLTCEETAIKEIKATITIPANGGSNNNGATANQVGQLESLAMIARFINEDITTDRVVTLLAQNVEKADDTYRNQIEGTNQNNVTASGLPAIVGITSSEPMAPREPNTPNMNFAVRANINDTVRELNTVVRGNAQAIMRGTTFDVEQKDDQLLQITATWRRDRADAIQNKIQSYFQ
tara:strand:- start:1264 stop:1992 length:729 start_codon:yes stop_codon:yes gene_type:complete